MRPFIHVNCAMSADGKIAGVDRKQVSISSKEDKDRVRELRRTYDAILVGVGTIISDDPHLTVKGRSREENQIRIVMDPHGRTPAGAQVMDDRARTIIVTSDDCAATWRGCDVVRSSDGIDLDHVLGELWEKGVRSILVEGGGTTIASFFEAGAVDLFTVYVGSMIIGGSGAPTPVDGRGWVCGGGLELELRSSTVLGGGILLEYVPVNRARWSS